MNLVQVGTSNHKHDHYHNHKHDYYNSLIVKVKLEIKMYL